MRTGASRGGVEGKKYTPIIDKPHRWSAWAAPKKKDGSFDHDKAKTGDDLIKYVDEKLFPYLKGFRARAEGANTIEYKIGEIFSEIENKFRSGYSLRDALELVDQLASARRSSGTNCPRSTRTSSAAWAMPGATAANIIRRARSSAP